jgi:formyltetrahydrofolate-dependent phosphoribosylglycinamide formyltransferase
VLVASNVADAPGLIRARELGFRRWCCRTASSFARRPRGGLAAALREAKVEWICLAGYMRLLSPEFVAAYAERILNIHPSLLPAFPGLHPQRQALAAGVRISGCTVHLVDAGLDSGPIVVQRAVPVEDNDDERLWRRAFSSKSTWPTPRPCRLLTAWLVPERFGGWRANACVSGLRRPFCRAIEKNFVEGVDRNQEGFLLSISRGASKEAGSTETPAREREASKTGRSAAVSESSALPRNSSSSRK